MSDENQKESTEDVQNNLFVHCPKVTFNLTRAILCSDCEYFKSMLRVSDDNRQEVALRVVCAHPITRSLTVVNL